MSDSQPEKKPAWTQWDIEQAWLEVVAARESGDIEAEALGMRRFSEGLRNSAMGAAGFVLRPLDEKIDDQKAQLSELMQLLGNARAADLNWRTEERDLRDKQSNRIYDELDKVTTAIGDLARGLGGLSAQVEDHEVRIVALETHGAPAEAVSELHQLRDEIKAVRDLLVVTRRQLWLTWIPVAAFVLLVVLSIVMRGGR